MATYLMGMDALHFVLNSHYGNAPHCKRVQFAKNRVKMENINLHLNNSVMTMMP